MQEPGDEAILVFVYLAVSLVYCFSFHFQTVIDGDKVRSFLASSGSTSIPTSYKCEISGGPIDSSFESLLTVRNGMLSLSLSLSLHPPPSSPPSLS